MKIVATYSFNKGEEFIEKYHKNELEEIKKIIILVDAEKCKIKESKEKTMPGEKMERVLEKLGLSLSPWNQETREKYRKLSSPAL